LQKKSFKERQNSLFYYNTIYIIKKNEEKNKR